MPTANGQRMRAGLYWTGRPSLGIPGITAHGAVFSDGPVAGQAVLVHGVMGAIASIAAQLAHRAGATVITTVCRADDLAG